LISLNAEIENDDNLGKGFKIGHSYLCVKNAKDSDLMDIVNYEIIPLLEEYWYDEPSQVEKWSKELISSLE
jgi:5-methylcytosine-specific restriction protein B